MIQFSNHTFGDMHVNIYIFFNLQNVSFLRNCGGLAIIVKKLA